MNRIAITAATLMLPCLAALAQTAAAPSGAKPGQAVPGVIGPNPSIDRKAIVAPPAGAAADPNSIIPGHRVAGLSEAQARQAMREAGTTPTSALTQDDRGVWHATGRQGSGQFQISIDPKGNVTRR